MSGSRSGDAGNFPQRCFGMTAAEHFLASCSFAFEQPLAAPAESAAERAALAESIEQMVAALTPFVATSPQENIPGET